MDISEILHSHNLKSTGVRREILELFIQNDHALSYNDLNAELTGESDKSTVYRTLKIFEEKGIIHTVLDPNQIEKYALCNHSKCSEAGHQDSHIHFHCNQCENTYCIDSAHTPNVVLPIGYSSEKTEVLVFGKCEHCG